MIKLGMSRQGGWMDFNQYRGFIFLVPYFFLIGCGNVNFPVLENAPKLPENWEVEESDSQRPHIIIDNIQTHE